MTHQAQSHRSYNADVENRQEDGQSTQLLKLAAEAARKEECHAA